MSGTFMGGFLSTIGSYFDKQNVVLFLIGMVYVFLLGLGIFLWSYIRRKLFHYREVFYLEVSKVQCKMGLVNIQKQQLNFFTNQQQQELFCNTQALLASKHPSFIKYYDKFKQDVVIFEKHSASSIMSQEEWKYLDAIYKKVHSLKRWYDILYLVLAILTSGIFLLFAEKSEV